MTEVPIKIQIVKTLSSAKPSRIVALKADGNPFFELYVTDKTGIPFPIKDNVGVISITNTDGNLDITGSTNKVINLNSSILTLINSALQPGDNVSELLNDAGYLTISDLPTKTSDLVNDGSDSTSTYVEKNELSVLALSNNYFRISDVEQKPAIPHTGTIALTIVANYPIIVGSVSNNFHLSIRNAMYTKTGNNGTLAVRHYISPSPSSTVGAVQISLHSGATSNLHTQLERSIIVREGVFYSFPNATATLDKTVSNATTAISATPLDFTTTDYWFLTVLALSSPLDSVVQQGLAVEFIT